MNIRVYLEILRESLRFAIQSIKANLLRTMLSLLGVTIGVFCIISILTLVDSMENNVQTALSGFGENTLFVQKWPWSFDSDYPWWKYVNRPEVKYREMEQLEKRLDVAEAISYTIWISNNKVTAGENFAESIPVRAVTKDFANIVSLNLQEGRYFSDFESQRGAPVAILGYDIAVALFKTPIKAVDQEIQVLNRKLKVIGVSEKEGQGIGFGGGDNQVTIPLNFARGLGSFESSEFNPAIMVKAKEGVTEEVAEDEVRGVFRSIRRLGPRDDDDFAINKMTMLTSFLSGIFDQISLYGWVIAAFSILVGGFGIANIMFVSVKERTGIIGIQKALGAKNYFIMIQFLGEAVILCVMGGLIGLTMIFLLSLLLNLVLPFKLVLTAENVMIGIVISSLIGILSGYIPSRQAAKMDPIQAIRFNQ